MNISDYRKFIDDFNTRMEKSLKEGWTIEKSHTIYTLCPPSVHVASINNWAAEYLVIPYKNRCIRVPHWFWD